MKRILSVFTAIAMLLALFAVSGCTKSQKSPKEMFKLGTQQLFASNFYDADDISFDKIDSVKMSINEAELSAAGTQAVDFSDVMPISLELTAKELDSDSLAVLGGVSVGGEQLSALVHKLDDEVNLSFPGISDVFFSGSLDDLTDETDVSFADIKDVVKNMKDACAKLMSDDNFTRESVDETIMEKDYTSLDKIKLTLSQDMISEVITDFVDAVSSIADEVTDDSVLNELPKMSAEVTYYFDAEDLKRANIVFTADDVMSGYDISVERNGSDVKFELAYTMTQNGETLVSAEGESYHTEKDGKIEGGSEMSYSATLPESYYDENNFGSAYYDGSMDGMFNSLDNLNMTCKYSGERSGDTVDLDCEYSYGTSGITVTVPFKLKIETGNELFKITCDIDTQVMMVDVKLNMSFELNRSDDIELPVYDSENAVDIASMKNGEASEENLQKLMSDFEEYVSDSEHLSKIYDYFIVNSGDEFEGDYYEDLDYRYIYNDYSNYSFYADNGYYSEEAKAELDGDILTAHAKSGDIMIEPDGEGYAKINGVRFEADGLDDGFENISDELVYFYSYDLESEYYLEKDDDGGYIVGITRYFDNYEIENDTLTLYFSDSDTPETHSYAEDENGVTIDGEHFDENDKPEFAYDV